MSRDIATSTALVTGANRGLGRHLAAELVRRGATVYAGARDPRSVDLDGVTAVQLDVTDPASIEAAVQAAPGVDLLVNNAGSNTGADLLTSPVEDLRTELDTHYLGSLLVTRAFLPSLEERHGAIANVLSVLSWVSYPQVSGYCAAKAAAWSMTSGLRAQLAPRGVTMTSLHVGYMDTDMAADIEAPKSDPADVARALLDAVAAGEHEVLYDDVSKHVQQGLAGGVAALYPQLARG